MRRFFPIIFKDRVKISLCLVFSILLFFGIAVSLSEPGYAACTDSDGDGYGVGDTCSGPDCNDSNAQIHPGATEKCNGIDDDCDGQIDETFTLGRESTLSSANDCQDGIDNDGDGLKDDADPQCQAGYCFLDTDGSLVTNPAGKNCLTRSFYECKTLTTTACPEPVTGLYVPSPEVPYTQSCHDGLDNDCDETVDGLDTDCVAAEQCNSLDDDYDGQTDEDFTCSACNTGVHVGDTCTVGTGVCERTGVVICLGASSAGCSIAAGTPKSENTPGTGNCIDGKDNDCDGYVDLADSGCQTGEKCDGIDNDGDGLVDEDFPDKGASCNNGLSGTCYAEGIKVCKPDGTGTICNAIGALASAEGPTGVTCSDGEDNDCDGLTDSDDPGCGSVDLAVWCSLPYTVGKPGVDCTGKHKVLFGYSGAGTEAEVTAELLALDVNGNVLASLPVHSGDYAHLASRIDPTDFRAVTQGNNKSTVHTVFAPVPLLRVTVKDALNKASAYCSNIPYLEVVEPAAGSVASESEGNVTPILTAIPLVNPSSLSVKVDGVDLFSALSKLPTSCTPATPCNGTVLIGGQNVDVSDLVVWSKPVDQNASNTVSMKLSNLGCGGHIVAIKGSKRPGSYPNYPSQNCNTDDLADSGISSVLAVEITSPVPGEIVFPSTPSPGCDMDKSVLVTGKACSGREIASLQINGGGVDLSGQTVTLGDGINSADTYEVQINKPVCITDIVRDVFYGDAPLGTFDPGSNTLVGMVVDDLDNRSYEVMPFAVGPVASPGVGPLSASSTKMKLDTAYLKSLLSKDIVRAMDSASSVLENAFVVGLSPQAIQTNFNKKCADAEDGFKDKVTAKIVEKFPIGPKEYSGGCSCNPDVYLYLDSVTFENSISCPVTFQDDKFTVAMTFPSIVINLHAYGHCKTTGLFGECWAETTVDGPASTTISGITMTFDVTEGQIKGTSSPGQPAFNINNAPHVETNISTDVGCVAEVCNFAGELFLTVLTFGTQGWVDLTPDLDVSKDIELTDEVGASKPDPISLGEIKVDEEKVKGYGQDLKGTLSDVQITPQGIVAGLTGEFSTLTVDPEVGMTPATLTPPLPGVVPVLPVSGAGDAFVVLSDDALNQLFASLTASGGLKTACELSDKTISDLVGDCDTIFAKTCSNDPAKPCKTDEICGNGNTCIQETIPTIWTGIKRGICHAFKDGNCAADSWTWSPPPSNPSIVYTTANTSCTNTKDSLTVKHIAPTSQLWFCNRQSNSPTLEIHDTASTPAIETTLRLNKLSVAMVVDRDPPGIEGELSSLPPCFAEGAPTIGDCTYLTACLDLNMETDMNLATMNCQNDRTFICDSSPCPSDKGPCVEACEGGNPGIVTKVKSIQTTLRQYGVVCGGPEPSGGEQPVTQAAAEDNTKQTLLDNATRFTPPACIKGLTLGDFVNFVNPRLIAIEAGGSPNDPNFQDYLGITGSITP
jgi:hypothetical protein